jgi:hypothetical protein
VLGGLAVVRALRERLAAIETQLNPLWDWWNERQDAEHIGTMGRR